MNNKEAKYYASEFTDVQIDTMADAGDFYLKESDNQCDGNTPFIET